MNRFEWRYVWDYFPKVLQALPTTLSVVFVAAFFGLIFGSLLAIARLERVPVLGNLGAVLVSFIRGTPIFIQMFVVYYALPMLLLPLGIDITRASKIIFVYITYALNVGGFFSETVRASLQSIPKDQWDAAAAVGHTRLETYLRIVVPQAAAVAIPSVGVTLTNLFQDSSLTFTMGVVDVIGKARSLGLRNTHTLEAYFVAAVIFVVLAILIDQLFAYLTKRTRTENIPRSSQ